MSKPENKCIKNVKITTFGYSGDAKSKKLVDLGYYYNFIPDSSMVGTAFCSWLANVYGSDSYEYKYEISPINTTAMSSFSSNNAMDWSELSPDDQYEIVRYQTYEVLMSVCLEFDRCVTESMSNKVDNFLKFLKTDVKSSIMLTELIKDFESINPEEEQIKKALSRNDWYKEWGYSYLLSLATAHKTRVCHNFKDKGVQMYSTDYIKELQDEVYDIYSRMPAPPPVLQAAPGQTYVYNSNMSNYVSGSTCWAPWCSVKLADGTYKLSSELDGSEILYYDGLRTSRIKYIIKSKAENTSVCDIKNLTVTEWHPVYDTVSETWVFPNELSTPYFSNMEYKVSIVLEDDHEYLIVNDIQVVSTAHNMKNFNNSNIILEHDYFGTDKVLEDALTFPINGKIITMTNYDVIRDNNNGRVCKIINLDSY